MTGIEFLVALRMRAEYKGVRVLVVVAKEFNDGIRQQSNGHVEQTLQDTDVS